MAHYSANIQVTKVDEVVPEPNAEQRRRSITSDPVKTTESFRVTVRATSIEKLKKKVKAHMDLIDGDDLMNEGED